MPKNTPILVTGVPGNVGSVGLSVVKLLRERRARNTEVLRSVHAIF
jgi:hypothetical protein